ncbi:MAG: transcription termination/antitermination factor NusG [Lachnospiraceae bacterium]|nr:transcription termination/antitermination factor NusG [Lachnospiraceae bacterium]
MAEGANWYVIHTYSGYENKVKANLEKTIENRKLQDQIFEVAVPVHDVIEIKNGTRKQVQKKQFPGYVLVNMIMNDNTWYVVRNTRGVTGFVGPGSKPVPLSEEEIKPLISAGEQIMISFEVGDVVTVVSGVWEGTIGKVLTVNENKQTVTIKVDMFGRETPVDISFMDIKKL